MLRKAIVFAIAILLASTALAQSPAGTATDKVFPITNPTPQGRTELANTVRAVAQVLATVDTGAGTLTVHGSPAQLGLSEWMLGELDRTAPSPSSHKYTVPGATDDIVRLFFLTNAQTPQAVQEIVNTIRSIAEVQKVSVCNAPKAIAMRGTASQVATTEWLVGELDKPAGPTPYVREYRMAGDDRNPIVHSYQLGQSETPQSTQELVNMIRTVTDLQRVVADNAPKMLLLRGASDLVAAADWLIGELQHPVSQPADFRIAGLRDPIVHLVYLTKVPDPQAMMEAASAVRSAAKMQRVVVYNPSKALAMRGTADQIVTADQVVKDRNQ